MRSPIGVCARKISIHALLAESDFSAAIVTQHPRDFYPRSPCGERLSLYPICPKTFKFLSTLSLRRATYLLWNSRTYTGISIHALLAESDMC